MNILITGASRGIGAALTKTFIRRGDHHIYVISRDKRRLEDLTNECLLINKNSAVIPMVIDLSDIGEIHNGIRSIMGNISCLDILVNNAGSAIRKPFEETSPGESENLWKINFMAPALLIKLLSSSLKRSEKPHVINICSMSGFQGSTKFPGLSYYGATKAALAVLTESLSVEYKDDGIAFNCLALGSVQTEMFSEVFPEFRASVSAEEIAGFIADFALKGHYYFNGKIIPVSRSVP